MTMNELTDVDASEWKSSVLESKEPVLVDFWHDACVWCKRLEPDLREIANEFPQLRFARLNVLSSDENGQLAQSYGIMGTPTLMLFYNGRVLQELVGYRPKEKLRTEIKDMVANCQSCFQQSTALKQ
jgi:thioredoxin